MTKDRVHTLEQAFAYVLDCNLATVSDMALKKNPPKGEFLRQISIAQDMLEWAVDFGVDVTGTRAEKILKQRLSVAEWALLSGCLGGVTHRRR